MALTGPASDSDVRLREILEAVRAAHLLRVADALPRRDPDELTDVLADRNCRDLAAALATRDVAAAVRCLFAVDPEKFAQARSGREARRVARALRSREPNQLAGALRGRSAKTVVQVFRKFNKEPEGGLDAVVEILRWQEKFSDPKAKAIRPLSAALAVVNSLPADSDKLQEICQALCRRDPLDPSPGVSIAEALSDCPDEFIKQIAEAVRNRHRAAWDHIARHIGPNVVGWLIRHFGLSNPQLKSDFFNEIVQSTIGSAMQQAQEGQYVNRDTWALGQLAGHLVHIAWYKAADRLGAERALPLPRLPGDGDEDRVQYDVPDERAEEVIHTVMREEATEAIESFKASRSCMDRVILEEKLSSEHVANRQIAERVKRDCADNECTQKRVERRWHELLEEFEKLRKSRDQQ